ncbi:MAG: porin, partial [Thiomicrospira sp.]|uniref:porin n=1 Tax=Thiomicrospira sp. TaxID=935 RepID=UPI0019E91CDB
NILAIAIASAVAAPVAMADAPTVYGQFHVAIESYDQAGTTGMDVESRNSRIGIKGSEDLGNGLKAIYQYELGVSPTVMGDNFSQDTGQYGIRNSFVGLSGGFGTVLMGRHDTPLRMIQPSDGFNDSRFAGNNTSNFNGRLAGEDRLNEVIAYMSPDFNGIKLMAAVVGQDNLVELGDDQSITNAMSVAVTYGSKRSGIYAAVAMTTGDSQNNGTTTSDFNDRTRATVQYKEAGLTASFMYNDEADKGTSMTLGVAYKMGKITPRAKVASVSYDAAGSDDAMNMAAGVDYALGKNTRVYAEYASIDKNNERLPDTTAMSVGLFHKF